MTRDPPRIRRSGRVILLDDAGRVLLLRFQMQRSDGPFAFWVTPGGEAEPDEPLDACARRELMEELRLDLPLTGPVHHSIGQFDFMGEWVEGHDSFFLARLAAGQGAVAFSGVTADEQAMHRATRWWTPAELRAATEAVFPTDLTDLIERLAPGPR